MSFDFSAQQRKGTPSVKWDRDKIQATCNNPDALGFWVADMDLRVAPAIEKAVTEAAKSGVYGYPNNIPVKESFLSFVEKRHRTTLEKEDVALCQGVLTSIAMLVELLTSENDNIIVPFPAYQPFVHIVNNLHRNLVIWPLSYDTEKCRFSLDFEKLEELASDASLLLFCSPHNPSGNVFSKEEIERVIQIAKKNSMAIVSDEIHADLAYKPHTILAPLAHEAGVVAASCLAPSKTFNIPGEHISMVVTKDKELKNRLETLMNARRVSQISFFALCAAQAAWDDGLKWLEALVGHLEEQSDMIDSYLKEQIPSLRWVKPSASFIAFIDCSKILDKVKEDRKNHPELYCESTSPAGGILSRFFGQRAGVCMNDGSWFGDEYTPFVRFNFGTSKEMTLLALQKIKNAVDSLT